MRLRTWLQARRSAGWFIAVGCVAATVHWTVAVALVSWGDWPPLAGNVGGWVVAVFVSFFGHHRLSFAGHRAPWVRATRRFMVISGAGLFINEVGYAVLLRFAPAHYALSLAMVLVAVAGVTYLASRHWAFAGTPTP